MAYIINKTNGAQLVVLEDGTVDTSTSVGLVGRNYTGYGEIQNENFVGLLENWANNNPPSRPISGQTWFNTQNRVLNVYSEDRWLPVNGASIQELSPEGIDGAFWYKPSTGQLFIYDNTTWNLIGPGAVDGFGATGSISTFFIDSIGNQQPVILNLVDDKVISVTSSSEFAFRADEQPHITSKYNLGWNDGILRQIISGVNLNLFPAFNNIFVGNLTGNATSANRLQTPRNINGVAFDGQNDITITSSTAGTLTRGSYLTGNNFNGSGNTTWSVDASASNQIGKVVARDAAGDFAAGTITADLVGNVTGNVTTATGVSSFNIVQANEFVGAQLSGNAFTATKLKTPRTINGIEFDGTANITVTAAASTLTGNTLAANITQLATLANLDIGSSGSITIGGPNPNTASLQLVLSGGTVPTLRSRLGRLNFDLDGSNVSFVDDTTALSLGGEAVPTLIASGPTNIGLPSPSGVPFNKIYADSFIGTAVTLSTLNPTFINGNITANGSLTVTGNLTVQGSVTALNSTELTIEDKTITLANNAFTAAAANGAGIFINGANASLTYANVGDKWLLNKPLDMGANNVTTTGLFQGTSTAAQYADLAENYLADAEYTPGTVLEFGGDQEVTLAQDETTRVAGVVSEKPAHLMNSSLQGEHVVALALQGRVPCKVRGKIQKGDMLVSAGNGYARPTTAPKLGTIIGKSLEDFEGSDGVIEVVVGRI